MATTAAAPSPLRLITRIAKARGSASRVPTYPPATGCSTSSRSWPGDTGTFNLLLGNFPHWCRDVEGLSGELLPDRRLLTQKGAHRLDESSTVELPEWVERAHLGPVSDSTGWAIPAAVAISPDPSCGELPNTPSCAVTQPVSLRPTGGAVCCRPSSSPSWRQPPAAHAWPLSRPARARAPQSVDRASRARCGVAVKPPSTSWIRQSRSLSFGCNGKPSMWGKAPRWRSVPWATVIEHGFCGPGLLQRHLLQRTLATPLIDHRQNVKRSPIGQGIGADIHAPVESSDLTPTI